MAKKDKKKIPKVPKNPDEFGLTHLLGNYEQKLAIYQDFRCPLDIQKEVARAYINEEEGFFKPNSEINYLKSLVHNPSLDPTLAMEIAKEAKDSSLRLLAVNNPHHETFKVNLLEKISSQLLVPFFGFLKENKIENLIRQDAVLTGSALASLIQMQTSENRYSLYRFNSAFVIKDWDFFFKDKETVKEIVNYFYSNFKAEGMVETLEFKDTSLGVEIVNLPKTLVGEYQKKGFWGNTFIEMVLTQNALTLKYDKSKPPVQFIFKVCASALEIIETFDFYHCQVAVELNSGKISWSGETLYSILNQKLLYHGGLNPLAAFFRMKKFEHRGWSINRLQIIKIIQDINKLNLNDTSTLKNQLQGFYFEESYPEIFKLPNKILTDDELWELLDKLSLKY